MLWIASLVWMTSITIAILLVKPIVSFSTRRMATSKVAYQAPSSLKGLFVGSGSDGMNEELICQAVLDLIGKTKNKSTGDSQSVPPNILYLGTATYDLTGPRERQIGQFAKKGCKISSLNIVSAKTPQLRPFQSELIENADAIVVSGGNTLYALDRWKLFGIDSLLRRAMERGAVLTGGSAGAICWFDGGHSDSADPDTWKESMVGAASITKTKKEGDESSDAPATLKDTKDWEYIRVPGLGFLPGLVCPHHDKTQSNGVLRATDFDAMLKRHSTEVGIGIDHWAALEVDGDSYHVVSVPGKEGSVLPNGTFSSTREGVPGIWIKVVNEQGEVESQLCPQQGKLSELLRHPSEITPDPRLELCRTANPAN
jgi:dipeptidase E